MSPGFPARERSIPADLGCLREARDFAAAAARDFGFDPDAAYAIKLVMSEAVSNAIQHGSAGSGDMVELSVIAEGDALVFQVRDAGRFRPRLTRRGELPERGRGLEFMSELMDEVDLRPSDGGTLMRFAKRRAA